MQLVDRTIDILILLSKESKGLTITEVSNKLDLPNSSVHRILQSLKKRHFVVQSSDSKKYLLGYKAITLGSNISENDNLILTARPYMELLSNKVEQTVAISVLQQYDVITIDYVESTNFMQLMVRKGVALPALNTSAGKAILAYKSIELVKKIYSENKSTTNKNIHLKEYDIYLEELTKVKHEGYSIVDEELQPGVHGIASPIFNDNKEVIAAISITAIKDNSNITNDTKQLLQKTALDISNELGANI